MKYKIWLIMLNISNSDKISLIERYGNEKVVYDELNSTFSNFSLQDAEEYAGILAKENIGLVTYNDCQYPEDLKNIDEPPYGLFYKGNIKLLNEDIVGIVGSRMCTQYGAQITKLLTKELISYNITIISGGAKGIDSVAHKTALEDGGNTIVVLGCGINVVYPKQNASLFRKIEDTGLIISEFLPGTKPLPYHFPMRNRIISGLSRLVIVAEASSKSGSLITANYAAEQGKSVMAVPGSIFSKGSNGCNKLIRDGAQIFSGMEDLYSILELKIPKKEGIISPIKRKILSVIAKAPTHIDEIVEKSCIDRAALFKVLFEMQIRNEIVSLPGNYYAKIT